MKYLSVCLSIIVLFSFFTVHAAADAEKEVLNKYNLIDDGFENTDTVTRLECLVAVMNAAGVTEEIAEDTTYLLVDPWYGTRHENSYYDFSEIYTDPVTVSEFSSKYCEKWTYLELAFYHGIAKGEMFHGKPCFFIERPVTAKEAVTFMLRCVEKSTDISWNEAYEKAKERNLVKESDVFYNDEDFLITPDEFCILLYRFLNQHRYVYFVNDFFDANGDGIEHILRDETGSMTYIEYLEQVSLSRERD